MRKTIEFNEVMFSKVFFSNSNIYGKIMFTVDVNNNFHIHVMKDLFDDSNKDFNSDEANINLKIPEDFIASKKLIFYCDKNQIEK